MADMRYPENYSASEMKKVAVTLLYEEDRIFSCDACGLIWHVLLSNEGTLPGNYWTCPNGCNGPEGTDQ